MNDHNDATTVSLRSCRICNATLVALHRFCRWCRASQSQPEIETDHRENTTKPSLITTRLNLKAESSAFAGVGGYRSLSGAILNSFVTRELIDATSGFKGRAAKGAVAVMITVPLWLMIVLL